MVFRKDIGGFTVRNVRLRHGIEGGPVAGLHEVVAGDVAEGIEMNGSNLCAAVQAFTGQARARALSSISAQVDRAGGLLHLHQDRSQDLSAAFFDLTKGDPPP